VGLERLIAGSEIDQAHFVDLDRVPEHRGAEESAG
jgi:hypothetical protein